MLFHDRQRRETQCIVFGGPVSFLLIFEDPHGCLEHGKDMREHAIKSSISWHCAERGVDFVWIGPCAGHLVLYAADEVIHGYCPRSNLSAW